MDQKPDHDGWSSVVWVIPLLIGLGFAMGFIVEAFKELSSEPIPWDMVGKSLVNIAVIFIPFALISWFLWARRGKKMPSLAFVVTVVTGIFFLLFSSAEAIGGFFSRPIDWTEAVGGLVQIVVFALPFLVVSWLLWFRPKIGAIVLICVGTAMGIWMVTDWNLQNMREWHDWMIPGILAGLPIILGAFTLVRELATQKTQTRLKNAG